MTYTISRKAMATQLGATLANFNIQGEQHTRLLRALMIVVPEIIDSELTSLIKELVAEAMPEPGTNLTSYEAQMFIISTEEYRQNLLKALEEK